MKPVVRFVISDVNMGLGHDGLNEVIATHKKKNPLFAKVMRNPGELVLFVNVARTKAKLYAEGGEVLGYLRMPVRRTINAETIDRIPNMFGGSVEYSRAVKSAFQKFIEADKGSKYRKADKTILVEDVG